MYAGCRRACEPAMLATCPLQVYGADECFVTGTFAGLIPVREVDGEAAGPGWVVGVLLLEACHSTSLILRQAAVSLPLRAGRVIGSGSRGPVTHKLQQLYMALMEQEVGKGRLKLLH